MKNSEKRFFSKSPEKKVHINKALLRNVSLTQILKKKH